MFRRILVAIDGSEHAYAALRQAIKLLNLNSLSQVGVLQVVPPLDPSLEYLPWSSRSQLEEAERKRARESLDKALAILREAGIEGTPLIRVGDPAQEIIEAVEEGNYELIVLGRRGTNPLKELLLGGVSQRVLQLAEVPVILAK
ncbi:MAG: universal stress protein [Desulfotomaculales bacterium]